MRFDIGDEVYFMQDNEIRKTNITGYKKVLTSPKSTYEEYQIRRLRWIDCKYLFRSKDEIISHLTQDLD